MKIDLPITIIFDCQQTDASSIARAAGHVVCTLRYDTAGDGSDAALFGCYPPNDKPFMLGGKEFTYEGEPAQAVLSHLPRKTDEKITGRAARSPSDYMVGTEEEIAVAQEESDEQAAEDGQFGAGA